MKILYPFVFLIAISCAAPENNEDTVDTEGAINEADTRKVLDHHWMAFKANNLEETMEDYTEESILMTPNGTYRGLREIRQNFINAFRAFPKDSSTLTLDKSLAVNDVGYILWRAETPEFTLSYATDTFIIRSGKIIRQTYAGVRE